MEKGRIQQLLAELRRELGNTRGLDADERESLGRLAEELDRAAQGEQPGPETTERSLLDDLGNRALRIESEHPRLAAVLGQIADTLGKMGI